MSSPTPATIVVVDDDAELLEAYASLLASFGHRVLLARSGAEALALARRERPDILVTDIVMPVMDGFELIQRLRLELGAGAPSAIVCSGFDITEGEALRRGAHGFLAKPIDADSLMAMIDSLRLHAPIDPSSLAEHRRVALAERSRARSTAESELEQVDRRETARWAQLWLEWLRVYLHCSGAGVLLLREAGLEPLVTTAGFPSNGLATGFLHTNVTSVVETRTSLVIGDARRHPCFRETLEPGADIAFFAGVPLLTPAQVAVGALCVSDPSPRSFEAESLQLLEDLGRRGVSQLLVPLNQVEDEAEPRSPAPLLRQASFRVLLGSELRIAAREDLTVEMAMLRLPPGASAHRCAVQLWRVGAGPRTAIGTFGPEQVALFKIGLGSDVSRLVAVCLESLQSQGLLQAAGVVSVAGSVGLGEEPMVRLAEGALHAANGNRGNGHRGNGKIRRVVVRVEK